MTEGQAPHGFIFARSVEALRGGDQEKAALAWAIDQASMLHTNGGGVPECGGCGQPTPCPTLRILTTAWADHPEHKPEWTIAGAVSVEEAQRRDQEYQRQKAEATS